MGVVHSSNQSNSPFCTWHFQCVYLVLLSLYALLFFHMQFPSSVQKTWWWPNVAETCRVVQKVKLISKIALKTEYSGVCEVYQCWWRLCQNINVFFLGLNIACFTFYIHLWPIYWLSLINTLPKHWKCCPKYNTYVNMYSYNFVYFSFVYRC
jgi:hypothetical protein